MQKITQQIIRRQGLRTMTNLSMATIYRLINKGEFPKSFQLSTNAVGWDLNDIHAWIDGRKAGQARRVA